MIWGGFEKQQAFLLDAVQWMRIWRTFPVFAWLRAAYAYREENFAEAAAFYRQGLKSHPWHPASNSAHLDLAYCLERIGDPEGAVNQLSILTSRNDSEHKSVGVESYLSKARLENYLGRHTAALQTLRSALLKFNGDSRPVCAFIHISLVTGLARNEIAHLIESLNKKYTFSTMADEQYLAVETALAHYELLLGDTAIGDKKLVRVLASGEAPPEATLLRGRRMMAMGRILQARELFRRVMILCPGDPEPLILLSESYLDSAESLETTWAIQLAETACKLSRWKRAEAIALLGRAYEKNQESEKAELFNECIRNMSQAAHLSFLHQRRDWWGRAQ